jgi:hypothetical protein
VGDRPFIDSGRVVYRDTLRDVAIVHTDSASKALPLRFELAETGEAAYAIGAPDGNMGSFSGGMVSHYHLDADRRRELIQVTAEGAPGSSGGPFLDRKGRVLGMLSEGLPGGNYALGVGSSTLKWALEDFSLNYPFCAVDTTDSASIQMLLDRAFPKLGQGELSAALNPSRLPDEIPWSETIPDLLSTLVFLVVVGLLLLALAAVLIRRHRRLQRIALRKRVRAQFEEIRTKAFLPDPIIEAECGTG